MGVRGAAGRKWLRAGGWHGLAATDGVRLLIPLDFSRRSAH